MAKLNLNKCVRCNRASEKTFHWCHKCFHEFDKIKKDPKKRRAFCSEKYRDPNAVCLLPSDSDDDE